MTRLHFRFVQVDFATPEDMAAHYEMPVSEIRELIRIGHIRKRRYP